MASHANAIENPDSTVEMNQRMLFLACCFAAIPVVSATAQVSSKLVERQTTAIRRIVQQGIQQGNMSGCVVAIGDRSGVSFLEAYGNRQVEPTLEPMTTDTVFDLASLTKPVATATSIFVLVDQDRLRLDEMASTYWPEFGRNGKESITIRQLLTHQAGLIPDNPLREYESGSDTALENICQLKTVSEPGTKFVYSDVGFIVLAEIVHRVSGDSIATFSHEQIYRPLKMLETTFNPAAALRGRAAATEKVAGVWLTGRVHDPRAARMDGIAGHAGLFSTAADLSRFAQMLLCEGQLEGVKILKPETVKEMTRRQQVSRGFRTLGWDSLSGYSSNRGDLFSDRAFGHGGFTGTSLWIDPELNLFVVFLSNRLHPDGKGSVNAIAGRIATVAAASKLDE